MRFCDKYPAVPPPSLYVSYERVDAFKSLLAASSGVNKGPGDGSEKNDADASRSEDVGQNASAYVVASKRWQDCDTAIERASKDPAWRALIVASDPLTPTSGMGWYPMPPQAILTYTAGT